MDLSIIIVNYNTGDFLEKCVRSIIKHTKNIKFEIYIVDNASIDDSLARVKKIIKKNIKIVESDENLGFACANNVALKMSKGDYALLLNPDTLIKGNAIGEMFDWMKANKEIGISSCALKNPDGSFQGTGGYFPNLLRVITWMTIEDLPLVAKIIKPFHPMRNLSYSKGSSFYKYTRELDWVTGAFFMFQRKLLGDIGLLDEEYFMYTEEVDYCYRAKSQGWKVVYNPAWSIIHFGGVSSGSKFAITSEFKGVKLFFKKHYPKWQYPILRLVMKIGSLGRMVLFAILGKFSLSKTYAKAFTEI